MNAPVCPVSRNQPIAGMPGVHLPAIPQASDLSSLLAAVNALRQALQGLIGPGLPLVTNPQLPSGGTVVVVPNWHETDRETENKRIDGKDDSGKSNGSSIDVVRINQVTFKSGFGDQFVWQYQKGALQ